MTDFNNVKTSKISKGTILLHRGDICNNVYKVTKGCLKSYVIDKSGKEHILQFAPEGWVIADLDSYINSKPSDIFIDAIEDTECIILNRGEMEELPNDPELVNESRMRLLRNIIATNKRLIALLSYTAEQRYVEFIKSYPTLIQRLPLKLIASYLGMTPEYLSEVRKKLTKK
jgi:CRP-like cAMP-binding protein